MSALTLHPTDEALTRNERFVLYLYLISSLVVFVLLMLFGLTMRMTKQLACDTLRSAYWRKKSGVDLLHHSDCGSQY